MSDPEREQQGERGFVVIDRRGRSEEAARPEPPPARPTGAPGGGSAAPAPGQRDEASPAGERLPPIDFSSFVHSIAISVLHHLGLVADPETGRTAVANLELARQNIDILDMIQSKTRGNLDPEESRLIETLLYELRMRYVEAKASRPQ
jgi:hypothetical protein